MSFYGLVGDTPRTVERVRHIAQFLRTKVGPYCIAGDFNVPPDELRPMVDDGGMQFWALGPTCHPSTGSPSCIDYFICPKESHQWVRHIGHIPSTLATHTVVRLGVCWRDHDPAPVWLKAQAPTLTDGKTQTTAHPDWSLCLTERAEAMRRGQHDSDPATFGDRHQCTHFRSHLDAFWTRWVLLVTHELQELDGQTHKGKLAPLMLVQQTQGPPNFRETAMDQRRNFRPLQ